MISYLAIDIGFVKDGCLNRTYCISKLLLTIINDNFNKEGIAMFHISVPVVFWYVQFDCKCFSALNNVIIVYWDLDCSHIIVHWEIQLVFSNSEVLIICCIYCTINIYVNIIYLNFLAMYVSICLTCW